MRPVQGGLLFAALLALCAERPRPALAQPDGVQAEHWALRTVGIPINLGKLKQYHTDKQLPEPTHVRLFSAYNRGKFQGGSKLALNNLDKLNNQKQGVVFEADKDGEFEFALQYIYADGKVSALPEELTPQARYVIDSVPPAVALRASGNGVEWAATDDNLDPSGVRLQAKRANATEWTTVPGGPMKARGEYAWKLGPGDALEVRVLAKDRAGNEGVSRILRIPSDGGGGRLPGGGPDWAPPPGGGGAGVPPQITTKYVNTLDFEVESTIHRMGRSGVRAVHLWVLKEQGGWAKATTKVVDLTPSGKDQTVHIPHQVERQGVYGFIVIPENGAGGKAPDPKKDDQPQILVAVDTDPPYVKITGTGVRAGGARGPIVEIAWEVSDQNLIPNRITLEYEDVKSTNVWKPIANELSNAPGTTRGRYEWEVSDPDLWKFKLRIRAYDKASNTGQDIYDKYVMVDLDPPAAGINNVKGGSVTRPPGGSTAPPPKKGDDPPMFKQPDPPKRADDPPAKADQPKLGPAGPPSLPNLPMGGGGPPPPGGNNLPPLPADKQPPDKKP